jgi:PST family polysaccharide transporter
LHLITSEPVEAGNTGSGSRHTVRRVLESIGILTAERALQLVSVAAVSVIVARALGPSTFGLYAFALSAVALVAPLLDVGQTILVRDLVTLPERRAELLASAFRVAVAISIVLQPVAIGFAFALPEDLAAARAPVVIAAVALLVRPLLVLDYWFQSRLDARRAATARLTGLMVGSLLRVAAAIHGGPNVVTYLAATTVIETAITGLFMLVAFRRGGGAPAGLVRSSASVRAYFRRVVPLLIAGLSVALYMRLDQVMLGLLSDTAEVGNYAVTVRLSEFAYFVPLVVSTSIMPGLSALYDRDPDAFYLVYTRVVGAFFAAALLLVAAVFIAAPLLVSTLFGSDFEGAVSVLRVHIFSLPFVFLGVAQTAWNAVHEQQKLAMWRTLGGAAINAALNFALIPEYGALGAACATVVAYAFAGVVGNAFSKHSRPFLWIQLRQASPYHLVDNIVTLRREVYLRLRSSGGSIS